VSQGLVALVEAIRGRLPRPVEVSLASWVPEAWSVVAEGPAASGLTAARGAEEIKRRVADAGVPYPVAGPFVVEVVRYLGDRCGSPLAYSAFCATLAAASASSKPGCDSSRSRCLVAA